MLVANTDQKEEAEEDSVMAEEVDTIMAVVDMVTSVEEVTVMPMT